MRQIINTRLFPAAALLLTVLVGYDQHRNIAFFTAADAAENTPLSARPVKAVQIKVRRIMHYLPERCLHGACMGSTDAISGRFAIFVNHNSNKDRAPIIACVRGSLFSVSKLCNKKGRTLSRAHPCHAGA